MTAMTIDRPEPVLPLKRSKYQDSGVGSYWIVDPEAPSLTVYDLVDGEYQIVADVKGDDERELRVPFEVRVTPSSLVTR